MENSKSIRTPETQKKLSGNLNWRAILNMKLILAMDRWPDSLWTAFGKRLNIPRSIMIEIEFKHIHCAERRVRKPIKAKFRMLYIIRPNLDRNLNRNLDRRTQKIGTQLIIGDGQCFRPWLGISFLENFFRKFQSFNSGTTADIYEEWWKLHFCVESYFQ